MKDLRTVADSMTSLLEKNEISKAKYTVSFTETREISVENDNFSLFRTLYDNDLSLTLYKDQKMGTAHTNKLDDASLSSVVLTAISSAQSADADEAYDIAPGMPKESFTFGAVEPDVDLLFTRIKELNEDIKEKHPKIKVMQLIFKHVKTHSLYRNTNGSEDEVIKGSYHIELEFAGNDGENTTGIASAYVQTADLSKPFITLGHLNQSLTDAENSLSPVSFGEKSDCTVIFTPECAAQMLGMALQNFVSDSVILEKTSLWLNKIGEQVAVKDFTLSINPWDENMVDHEVHTVDGFRSKDFDLIQNGILKSFMTSLYIANKTGVSVAPNSSYNVLVAPGEKSLSDIIKSIDRGIVIGSFSGGHPSANGEFSGIAKNSFLIENGAVKNALAETMVNGNLADFFMNISAISKETLKDGTMVMPYLAVDHVVVSSK